jgi:methanethiol S-methyltransferase
MKSTSRPRNWVIRIALLGALMLPVILSPAAYVEHFRMYLCGGNLSPIIKGEWHLVALNTLFFISFLVPLSFRRKIKWSEYGLVTAFFASLFVEMYGVPFTLMFVSGICNTKTSLPPTFFRVSLLGRRMVMDLPMFVGAAMMTLGMVVIGVGWVTLYRNVKRKGGLVTTGIYAYSRHPQYVGFLLIVAGWFLGWPTIMTTVFAAILVVMYVRVCLLEDTEMAAEFPEAYASYREAVPLLI